MKNFLKSLAGKALGMLGGIDKSIITYFDTEQENYNNTFFLLIPKIKSKLYILATTADNNNKLYEHKLNLEGLKDVSLLSDFLRNKVLKGKNDPLFAMFSDEIMKVIDSIDNNMSQIYNERPEANFSFALIKRDNRIYLFGATVNDSDIIKFVDLEYKGKAVNSILLSDYLSQILTTVL